MFWSVQGNLDYQQYKKVSCIVRLLSSITKVVITTPLNDDLTTWSDTPEHSTCHEVSLDITTLTIQQGDDHQLSYKFAVFSVRILSPRVEYSNYFQTSNGTDVHADGKCNFCGPPPPFGMEPTPKLWRRVFHLRTFNVRVVSRVFQQEQTRKVWVNLIKSPFPSAANFSPFLLAILLYSCVMKNSKQIIPWWPSKSAAIGSLFVMGKKPKAMGRDEKKDEHLWYS